MKTKLNSRVFAISVALIIVASCAAVLYGSSSERSDDDAQLGSKTNNIFSLKYPPFLIASAQETEPMMGATQTVSLEDEAGICAYYNVGSEIDLTNARDAYQSIDTETDEYIIGIVAEGGFEEIYPRVYTRKDGWIMAYLPKEYPEGGIFQYAQSYCDPRPDLTTLFYSIRTICNSAGFGQPDQEDLAYYNFQQPDAEEMLVTGESAYVNVNEFNYTIQSQITTYSASYSLMAINMGVAELYIDDKYIDSTSNIDGQTDFVYGQIDPTYLEKDVTHNAMLNATWDCGFEYIVFFYST